MTEREPIYDLRELCGELLAVAMELRVACDPNADWLGSVCDRLAAATERLQGGFLHNEAGAAARIQQWCRDVCYKDTCLFVERLKPDLPPSGIAHVLKALDGICKDCWDGDGYCQCENDE